MGSKNTIARWVVQHLPKATNFYDLFAGGCAVTHAALLSRKYQRYYANDIADGMTSLFLAAINGKFRNEKRWISREQFFAEKDTDMYIRVCWSFGNYGHTYMYSKEIEPYKKALHFAVVFNDWVLLKELCPEVWESAYNALSYIPVENTMKRRMTISRVIAQRLKEIGDYSLVKSNILYNFCHRLQSLERLESLESLQSLERLQSLVVRVGNYEDVDILPDSVIYCDPPYKGTASYNDCVFNHARFYDWCRKQTMPILISEYQMPEDFVCIDETSKAVTLSAGAPKMAIEKLFCPAHQVGLFQTHKQLSLF